MNLKLEARYLQLEKSRKKLLNELANLDDTLLNTCVATGTWSVNQVVAHLVLLEEVTVHSIQRKLQQPDKLQLCGFASEIRFLLMKLAMKSWLKFKAPAAVASVPENATLSNLSSRWDTIRYRLEDMLADFPEELLDKAIFKHPIAGPLTILQTLYFLEDHFRHHLQQINQVKKQLHVSVLQK